MAGDRFSETCGICRGFCYPGNPNNVTINVWDSFSSKAYVPCNTRVYVNNATGKYMRFEFEGKKYSIDVVKKPYWTIFRGRGWRKFTADNNLPNGCAVIFNLEERPCQAHKAGIDVDEVALNADDAGDGTEDTGGIADLMKFVNLTAQEEAKV